MRSWVLLCLVILTLWTGPGFLVPQHLSRAPAPNRVPLRAKGVQRDVPTDNNTKDKVWSWNLFAWCTIVALGSVFGGLVVLCSAIAGLFGLWIGGSAVQRGSMARFACRGATLAVALANLFEEFLERFIWAASPHMYHFLFKTRLISVLGGVEEVAKFISLIWFSWSGAKFWRCKRPLAQQGPKEVMLAGFSTGVGFMVEENCVLMYHTVRMLLLRAEFSDPKSLDLLPSFIFTSGFLFRVLLNPHPFLTGIAAGRFTKFSNAEKLTLETMWSVLWPSILLHALINALAAMHFPLGLRVLFQIFCWMLFRKTWKSLEKPQESSEKDMDGSAS